MNFVLISNQTMTVQKTTDQYIINIDDKFLNKILMNKIKQHIKRMPHDQKGFIQRCRFCSILEHLSVYSIINS